MFRNLLRTLAIVTAVTAAHAQQPAAGTAPDPLAALVAQRLEAAASPACILVGVVDESTRVAYACTRDAGPATLDRDSLFEIGSITKAFTGLLLADMVRRGEVALADPASRYAKPGARIPERGGAITLQQLVTHTSGLPRLPPDFRPKDPLDPYAAYDVDALYASLAATTLARDVGRGGEYSNYGFMWLSELLSRRAGKPFPDLLAERVLEPLGMNDTALVLGEAQRKRMVQGHDAQYRPVPPWGMDPQLAGAGGLRSSMNDMLKLAAALANRAETPLHDTIALSFQPLLPAVAFAWQLRPSAGGTLHWHNGGTGGARSMLVVNRAAKRAAIVLADSVAEFEDLAFHLVEPSIPLAKKRVAIALDEAVLAGYAGSYELRPGTLMKIAIDKGRVITQVTGQAPVEIFPEAKDRFFVRAFDAQIAFNRGADGKVESLTLFQAGREFPARRLP